MRPHVLFLALSLISTSAHADAWIAAPANYTYAPIARCADAAAAALKPNEARYEICTDQVAVFDRALTRARAAKKLLIVDFGATWCPWCRSLQAQCPSAALLGHKSPTVNLADAFDIVEIGISTMHAGRRIDVPSGQAVLGEVLAAAGGVKLRAVPFLAIIDPNDRSKTVARNLDDFEQQANGQHDPKRIRDFLIETHAYIRHGKTAPAEPGWLRAKLNRAWMRLFGA